MKAEDLRAKTIDELSDELGLAKEAFNLRFQRPWPVKIPPVWGRAPGYGANEDILNRPRNGFLRSLCRDA